MSFKSTDYVNVQIIDDSDSESDSNDNKKVDCSESFIIEIPIIKKKVIKKKVIKEKIIKEPVVKEQVVPICLLKKFHIEINTLEIGADEVGRGPMLGRVYSGAVILPKDDSFDHFKMKDSKKFTSKNPSFPFTNLIGLKNILAFSKTQW